MTFLAISTSAFQAQVSDLLPCNNNAKSSLTFAMLKAYGLIHHFNHVIDFPYCSKSDLKQFHSQEYLDLILNSKFNSTTAWDDEHCSWGTFSSAANNWMSLQDDPSSCVWFESKPDLYQHFLQHTELESDTDTKASKRSRWGKLFNSCNEAGDNQETDAKYDSGSESNDVKANHLVNAGLSHDCHPFAYLPMYCQVVTGATIKLARYASSRQQRTISVNWDGGRHHAFKSKASGFCYVNDIAILIQKLRRRGIHKISYLDFDLHHGDGVERAFQHSANVQTISIHMYEEGFFPGTGTLKDASSGRNIVNIPVLHGMDDTFLNEVVNRVVIPCLHNHNPEVVIIQCGGDGLIGDKYKEWQLTLKGLTDTIMKVVEDFPSSNIVLLGGGGYNEKLMSRFYTYLTWRIVSKYSENAPTDNPFDRHDDVIPDHEFIDSYKDEFYKFWAYDIEGLKSKLLKNHNSLEHIEKLARFYKLV